jgi:hypothetical protein
MTRIHIESDQKEAVATLVESLLIEEYFVCLEQTFASCPHVVQTTLTK